MTDTTPTSTKAPTHAAYHVRDREGKKAIWTRVGAAWAHADGKGFTAHLDCAPLDGRVGVRLVDDKPE